MLKRILRALHHRNFRLFFFGQSVSLIGTWIQQIAVSWLVYRLTHSPFMLGLVNFSSQIPSFIFAPFAGVFADRLNKKRMLIVTQVLAMLQALLLAFLVLFGVASIPWILSLSLLLGLINAFDIPLRQSFLVEMIDRKEDLGNAIALNSTMFHAARLIGPTIAGVVIGLFGETLCFFLNAFSYIAVIAALLLMKIKSHVVTPHKALWHEMKEGFAYAYRFHPIRFILLLIALVSLMGMPYLVLMPIFAGQVFHGGPHTYGFLIGAAGLGALLGALYMAFRTHVRGLSKNIAVGSGIFGLVLILFSFSKILWVSMVLMFFSGTALMVQMSACNTILQTVVEDDKRGRVMSFFAMAFMGTSPIGGLLAGSLASKIGAPHTLLIGGIACCAASIAFATQLPMLRNLIRNVYVKKGVIPPDEKIYR